MAICGVTDRIEARLPRIGKLRKGGEKVGNSVGPDLDHFRFTSDRSEVVEAFEDAFGKMPRVIPVFTVSDRLDDVFPTWAEVYSASGLMHRCDGKTMHIWREGNRYVVGNKPCPGGHTKNDYRNDAVGRLEVVIPALLQRGFVGTVTLETHSINDIISISRTLRFVENVRGTLYGAAFNLRRVQEVISTPGFGNRSDQRSRATKWLVRLEPIAEWAYAQLTSVSENSIRPTEPVKEDESQIDVESELETPPTQLPVPNAHDEPTERPNFERMSVGQARNVLIDAFRKAGITSGADQTAWLARHGFDTLRFISVDRAAEAYDLLVSRASFEIETQDAPAT